MKVLTAKAALGLLADVVLEHGTDTIYKKVKEGDAESCVYVLNEAPSCLVGHVLSRFGIPLDFMGSLMRNTLAASSLCYKINNEAKIALTISDDAAIVLGDAQDAQDSGQTWGTALAVATRTYVGLGES